MKGYTVFNVEQIDGLPGHFYAGRTAANQRHRPRSTHAERFFAATGATIRHGGGQAFYSPGHDIVQMPPHPGLPRPGELLRDARPRNHATGRGTRRASTATSGASGLAMPAMRWRNWSPRSARPSCAPTLASPRKPREDHAAYIGSWLKVLKNDKRAIFTAASHAQRAADHLHGYQSPAQDANRQPVAVSSDYARTLDDTARRARQRGTDRGIDR